MDTKNLLSYNFHHIGGRGGQIPFSGTPLRIPDKFYSDVIVHLYDADPQCAKSLSNTNLGYTNIVHPVGIWERTEKRTFHINYETCSSSLLPKNDAFNDYYRWQNQSGDYSIGDAHSPQINIPMSVTSIDDYVLNSDYHVDYLSIDAQGAELPILRGASNTIENSIVGVMAEISINEMYKGQAKFPELLAWMLENGFQLVDLTLYTMGAYRGPVGWRAGECLQDGDAFFIKDASRVATQPNSFFSLIKLAFTALSYGLLERAIEAMEMAERIRCFQHDFYVEKSPPYVQMLFQMMDIFRESDKIYPICFSDVFSNYEAVVLGGAVEGSVHRTHKDIRRRFFMKISPDKRVSTLSSLIFGAFVENTKQEIFLYNNGFSALSADMKNKRIDNASRTLSFLGIQWAVHNGSPIVDENILSEVLSI